MEKERQANEAPEQAAEETRRPARYKLYDRIGMKVSLQTMNWIVYGIVGLLVLSLVVGIVIGN